MDDDEYMADEQYDLQYSEDSGSEPDVDLENQYYNSKALKNDDPRLALENFREVLRLQRDEKGEWGFKALKQMVKICFQLNEHAAMLEYYKQLLTYIKSAVTRNYSEKAINSILDYISTSNQISLLQFYETTLDALKDARNERLWFKTNTKLAKLYLDRQDFSRLSKILKQLRNSCQNDEGEEDVRKGTQLLEIYALEIQMYTDQKNNKKLKALYEQSLRIKSAIPHPLIMGVIRECGGKMHLREGQFEKAHTDFFEAFKNYDESGNLRRSMCLKYLVLANMLMKSDINPFDSQEAKPYKNDPEILAMTNLVSAYQNNDVNEFERILKTNKVSIMDDPFIREHIEELLKNIRTQVMIKLIKPYTHIHLPYLAKELNIDVNDVESLLVQCILDGTVKGKMDQTSQIQQSLSRYFPSSNSGSDSIPNPPQKKIVSSKSSLDATRRPGKDSVKKTSQSSTKPLIVTELKFKDQSNNKFSPLTQTITEQLPVDCSLDVTVMDISTPKRTKKVDTDVPSSSASLQNQQPSASSSIITTVDLCCDDSDDEPTAKKIKIDAKKYEKIQKSVPKTSRVKRDKETIIKNHFERAISAVLKHTNPKLKKQRKVEENKSSNSSKQKQMPALKKQPSVTTVKQKLLALKSTVASGSVSVSGKKARTTQGQNIQGLVVKPLSHWVQSGKLTLKDAQGFLLKSPLLPLSRLEMPKILSPGGFKIQQKGVLLHAPNKVLRMVAPQLSSAGQGPSALGKKLSISFDANGKGKILKSAEKHNSTDVLEALKARNILISPISRKNVVKNNLTRLEAKWKACQSNSDHKAQVNYRQVANVVLSVLNKSELEQIKDEMLKKDMLSRYQLHHERLKLKNMTAEERKTYMQQKHKEEMERRRIQYELTKVKYEDTEISPAAVLPQPTLFKMSNGLLNIDIGDVLMVTDFLIGFSELLSPQERLDVNIDSVLQALNAVRTTGFQLLTKMLVAFLETLLQTESHVEMGTGLEDIAVNCYTASELTRLISNSSRGGGDDETDSGFDASSSFNETLNEECMETIRTADFYTLYPKTIVDIFIFVQNKLLQAPNFDEFLKEKEEELTEAWKEKQEAIQELKKYKAQSEVSGKSEHDKEVSPKDGFKENKPNTDAENALSITHFYGSTTMKTDDAAVAVKKTATSVSNTAAEMTLVDDKLSPRVSLTPVTSSSDNDENDLLAIADIDSMVYKVKNRRIISEQLKAKRAEEERAEKER